MDAAENIQIFLCLESNLGRPASNPSLYLLSARDSHVIRNMAKTVGTSWRNFLSGIYQNRFNVKDMEEAEDQEFWYAGE
jgi:hypothetical protein